MKQVTHRSSRRLAARIAMAMLCLAAADAPASEVPHLTTLHQGGFPGSPVMTGIAATSNGLTLTWDGPAGYYQLYQKLGLSSQTWQKFGAPNLSRLTNLAAANPSAFFKVAGPPARYAGTETCMECHENIGRLESHTRHASAFTNPRFIAKGGQTNSSCLPCHTVGYGLPTGFINENLTPHLAGVQCENCHGPAAKHAANELDFTVRPRAELAGQVCGGCHNAASHRPRFEQWSGSAHFTVTEDMNPPDRINSCGRCHSGSARLALMKGENPSVAVTNDANVAITCAVCHDPHASHVWTNILSGEIQTNQIRYPFASTNDFFLSTSAPFTNRYDINVCAQCHNHRGATWNDPTSTADTSGPPHHSPQYNMLLGTVGELEAGVKPWRSAHATLIEQQCIGCHMTQEGDGSEDHPYFAGHTFRVTTLQTCQECHPVPELLVQFAQTAFTAQIKEIKGYLDLWATTKAPESLRTQYGALAWEYTHPGELSHGPAGPTDAEQELIPDNIKKARFNLYLVNNDGSLGIHNAAHATALLEAARNWLQAELGK